MRKLQLCTRDILDIDGDLPDVRKARARAMPCWGFSFLGESCGKFRGVIGDRRLILRIKHLGSRRCSGKRGSGPRNQAGQAFDLRNVEGVLVCRRHGLNVVFLGLVFTSPSASPGRRLETSPEIKYAKFSYLNPPMMTAQRCRAAQCTFTGRGGNEPSDTRTPRRAAQPSKVASCPVGIR
jgi:hypothetical protein